MIGRPPLEGLYSERKAGPKAKDSGSKDTGKVVRDEKEARREKERRDLEELLKDEREKREKADKEGAEAMEGDEMVLTTVKVGEGGDKTITTRSRKKAEDEKTEAEKEEDALRTEVKPKRYIGRMSAGTRRLAIIGIIALILIPLFYFLIIPRTELVVTVQYSEGFQNAIFLDAKAENRGTRPVDGLTVKITVINQSDTVVTSTEMETSSSIAIWTERDFDFHRFQGNQRVNYAIIVDVELESAGRSLTSSDTFYVKEYMNQRFELTVSG